MKIELNYWKEILSEAAESAMIELSAEQLDVLSEAAMMGHKYYREAFYSPPASDRLQEINREWGLKLKQQQDDFDKFRRNAMQAIKTALKQDTDTTIGVGEHGEVFRYDGRHQRIQ